MIINPYTCLRCGHTWNPRSEGKPVACPKCHSTAWDKEKKKEVVE